MKVVLGQINTTPGDFSGNVEQIIYGINFAFDNNADMIIFPELSIPGYLTCDKMFQKNYIKKNRKHLHDLITYSLKCPDLYIIVGYIGQNNTGCGKPFANLLAVINDGTLIGKYQKRLIPNHDVFDEYRYYEPGRKPLVLNIKDEKVFFSICEDLWANDKGETGIPRYGNDPLTDFSKSDATLLVSINSSPYSMDKPEKRNRMLTDICPLNKKLIYVNQQGGQDELVFDGHSCFVRENSVVYQIKNTYEHDLINPRFDIIDTNGKYMFEPKYHKNDCCMDDGLWNQVSNVIVAGLHDYVKKSGFGKVIVGSSGGIDSAVTLALACKALGPENVTGVMMPSIWSSEESVADAKELHKQLGCNEYCIPIDHQTQLDYINDQFGLEKGQYNSVADQNIQARIRGMTLMHYSNATGQLVLTTGNKTECAVGYFTLYGDSVGGFNPIKDLYKMEVYALADYLNIPESIMQKAPSAELEPDQKDENQLLPYPLLDCIVKSFIEDYIDDFEDFIDWLEKTKHIEWVEQAYKILNNTDIKNKYFEFINIINKNEFKRRQTALGVKLSKVAFGTGRRLPIVGK